MGTSFDPGLLSALKTWEGLSEIASADDPFKRVVAVVFGTPLVEGRLSELGIMGWGHGQVSSLHKAVRRAEKRFLLEPTVVAAGLRAIKDRNKVAHHDPGVRLLDDAASDAEEDEEEDEDEDGEEDGEEESSDSIEAILERAPQVVEQLWALDAEIEKGAAEEDARRSAEVGARRRKEKEIERRAAEEEVRRQVEEMVRRLGEVLAARAAQEEAARREAKREAERPERRARRKASFVASQETENQQRAREVDKERTLSRRVRLIVLLVAAIILLPAAAISWSVRRGNAIAASIAVGIAEDRASGAVPEFSEQLTSETEYFLRQAGVNVYSEVMAIEGSRMFDGIGEGFVHHFALLELPKRMGPERAIYVILSKRDYGQGIRGAESAAMALWGKPVDRLTADERRILAYKTAAGSLTKE